LFLQPALRSQVNQRSTASLVKASLKIHKDDSVELRLDDFLKVFLEL
jgi:hypothetical protein